MDQPGAALLVVGAGEGQPWAVRLELKPLIFCVFSIFPDSVNGMLQLCPAGKCPMLVPAHPSFVDLAVCTECVPPAGAATPGKMDRDKPASSAPAAPSEQ